MAIAQMLNGGHICFRTVRTQMHPKLCSCVIDQRVEVIPCISNTKSNVIMWPIKYALADMRSVQLYFFEACCQIEHRNQNKTHFKWRLDIVVPYYARGLKLIKTPWSNAVQFYLKPARCELIHCLCNLQVTHFSGCKHLRVSYHICIHKKPWLCTALQVLISFFYVVSIWLWPGQLSREE